MRSLLAVVSVLVLLLAFTASAQAQGYGYGMGPGMMGGYGYGPGMMGGGYGGYGMGPGMMGGGYGGYGMGPGMMGGYGPGYGPGSGYAPRPQSGVCHNFLNETQGLRKDLLAKRFEYSEAMRNPKTTPETLSTLEKEIGDLRGKIQAKNAEGCWW